jgi:hypothetical protein
MPFSLPPSNSTLCPKGIANWLGVPIARRTRLLKDRGQSRPRLPADEEAFDGQMSASPSSNPSSPTVKLLGTPPGTPDLSHRKGS